jgi:hypothetical protein
MSAKWQKLTEEPYEYTESLRIPGGWLHRSIVYNDDEEPIATALAFQPERAE